jgi:hypothetical protein
MAIGRERREQQRRRRHAATLVLLLVTAHAATSAARFDPSEITRMAVTDRSITAGMQARIWTVSVDNLQLTSKRPELNEAGWTQHLLADFRIDSGLDAVSLN